MEEFRDINTWVFDLDNTLYPRHCDLFAQIDVLMTDYVSNLTGLEPVEARKLQKDLYRDYGTTLRGLMATRDIDPHEFLDHVHDIDYTELAPNPALGEMLVSLPGRKLIYTNGSVRHAENTLSALGISHDTFEAMFDIAASDFEPKPKPEPFRKFIEDHGVEGRNAAMFEDMPRNLQPAKANGMVTVLITPQTSANFTVESWEHAETGSDYIDHSTDDLDNFLAGVLEQINS